MKSQLTGLDIRTEQRTLNPRVRGSSPWRRTRTDLSSPRRWLSARPATPASASPTRDGYCPRQAPAQQTRHESRDAGIAALMPKVSASCVAAPPPLIRRPTTGAPVRRPPASGYKLDVILTATHTQRRDRRLDRRVRPLVRPRRKAGRPAPDHRRRAAAGPHRPAGEADRRVRDLQASPASPPARTVAGRPSIRPEVAVRIICWFPADDDVVIALIGFDKKTIGDVSCASAAARGEALV